MHFTYIVHIQQECTQKNLQNKTTSSLNIELVKAA